MQSFEECFAEAAKFVNAETNQSKTEEEWFLEYIAKAGLSYLFDRKYLPVFYSPHITKDVNEFKAKLREEARGRFFDRELNKLLTGDELKHLWTLLQDYHISPPNHVARFDGENNLYINYTNFVKVKELLSDKYEMFFKPSVFLQLQDSGHNKGFLSVDTFFNYIMKKIWSDQTRNGLSQYDSTGLGYLTESGFEAYILDLIPTLTQLKKLEKTFYAFYACMVVRKFFFYLDPLHTGKIRIVDILSCGFLDDLLELREENCKESQNKKNWFSVPSALRIYSMYLELDKDHNGLLNREELASYKLGSFTSAFLDRVFQVAFTFDGQMDYKGYLNFVLATENRNEPQALRYLFKFLDIKDQGYLDSFTINYFSRAVADRLPPTDGDGDQSTCAVSLEDIKDEIFDMIKPEQPDRITLKDIVRSGMGQTLVNILVDVNGFWSYEFRETIASNQMTGVEQDKYFSGGSVKH
ncbi:serine/threonine-protein phosphatase 2A regulatory subunit B'' subunit gamma-like [Daktulosphaira vitifoliae]|uniref:serine/threonine-protein phosphatase 2A regulatory subunit B'' subunit gamma-like n=1 Tax=Daktulosphaira vitifoliae TaxID=58002 RepID=UPI0021AA0575|nr:serine/threonine-protein phosphatase 2A regulatory subunit B'' subunit gamma-like [Daktulosphaira vitifoliae]XP_050529949.1 serine/threonine-protein phosphatase 2A regulatory subunit B'' subunit gamma-like [Daktulosphaira vitifoliae]XP_050529950.1 serine/threonine-protein phosphatase 2A regulatory subunit B'' subunit gamma-like [Daktulosphaira vitifoliae]